ncbi:ABC transporter permease [Ectothiorhodospira mobilis]|uniref:ABC transporter permease n=1 Tax=Ectothiorhodospira mobilis TaxID=195064 RepID=UPI001EE962E3|nr:ABC transporter permease [Ectothiorhodospira mobilis]MCG5536084.1 ABC transporter permease [Ectothiorhodospira mobilis]
MSSLFLALLRDHRRHPWNVLLSILGVALGVAVVVGVDLANSSASRAFELSLDAVSGRATHQVLGGPAGLDEAVYTRLRLAGVRDSAPVVEGHVRIRGETLTLLGLDPFAEAPFRSYAAGLQGGGMTGLITSGDGVALSRRAAHRLGLEAGEDFTLEVLGERQRVTLETVLDHDDPALDGILVADIAHAQGLLDRVGRLDRIDLILKDRAAVQRVRALLPPGADLVRTEGRNEATLQLARAFQVNLAAMSLLALLVGGFLVYNTMIFSVLRRRRLLALLRMQGMTGGELGRRVMAEALVVGLVGTLLGLLAGTFIGRFLLQMVTRTISDMYFVLSVTGLALSPWVLLKGLALGLGATAVAALGPAWEAARVSPRDALSRSHLERRVGRLIPWLGLAGVGLMALGLALILWPSRSLVLGFVALFTLILGYALLVPPGLMALSRGLAPVMGGVFGAMGRMAARGVSAGLSRSALAVAALAVAVSATIGVGVMVSSFRTTVDDWLGQTLQGDVYVSAPGRSSLGLNPLLPDAARPRLQALEAVQAVSTARRVPVQSPRGTLELMAVDPAPRTPEGYRFRSGERRAAWEALARRDAVIVSEPLAWRLQLYTGDRLTLRTDRGLRDFEIVGVVQEYGSDRGLVTIHRDRYDRYWDDPGVASLALFLDPGIPRARALADVREAVAGLDDPVLVTPTGEIREEAMAVFDRTFAITHVLRLLTVGVAFVGVLSALMALQLERAREHAVLRATGVTPRELGAMVALQSVLLGLAAGLFAIPLGLLMSDVLIDVINRRSFGWSMAHSVPWGVLADGLWLAVAAALLAGAYPGYRMSRARPAEHLREE